MSTPQTFTAHPQQDLLQDFFARTEEAMDGIEQDLIRLEALAQPEPDTLKRLLHNFAAIETEAETFAFTELLSVLRQGRHQLESLRSGTLDVTIATMNTLFQLNDQGKSLLKQYQAGDFSAPVSAPVEVIQEEEPVVAAPVTAAAPQAEPVVETASAQVPAAEAAEPEEDEIVAALSAQAFYRDGNLVIEVAGQTLPPQAFNQASLAAHREGFSLSLPLHTAPIQALLVTLADKTLALPVENVVEVQRLSPTDITTVKGQSTVTLRGQKLPLCDAGSVVDLSPGPRDYMVVLQDGTTTFALAIDQWLEPEEISFRNGTAITAEGQAVLVVDIALLRRAAQV